MDEMTEAESSLKDELFGRGDFFVYLTARRWLRNVENLCSEQSSGFVRCSDEQGFIYFYDDRVPTIYVLVPTKVLVEAGFEDIRDGAVRATMRSCLLHGERFSQMVMN